MGREITGPLGLDFYIGLPEEEFDRTVPLSGPAVLDHWAALQSLLPACGRLIEVSQAVAKLIRQQKCPALKKMCRIAAACASGALGADHPAGILGIQVLSRGEAGAALRPRP
eukprot:COSAG01_NODE_1734_length_9366_cov_4.124636_11_plen_112_part_00